MGVDRKDFSVAANWQTPQELPDLRRVGIIALDTETRDEGLRAGRGSSWAWGDGHIAGISVAYRADGDTRAHYFPLRHPDTDNFDPAQVYSWLTDLIASGVRFVTQNGGYDWGWLRTETGIKMPLSDYLEEIGALATIIDENRSSYKLDALCKHYGLPGKDETLLKQAVEAAGFLVKRAKEYIWQLPARFVGPYAEIDAVRTLELFETLNPILDREGTRDAYRLEVDLMPMVLEMRLRGIRIDQDAAEQAREQILQKRDAALAELSAQLGTHVSMNEINRNKWKVQTFDAHHISYPRTAKGNPSFAGGKSGWMARHPHWLPQLIATARKYHDAGSKFLEGYVLKHVINGRIHAEIHPFRADDGGARSSRFAYSNPPLQQMPSRDKELGPLIRGVFLPEEGELWAKPDVSQQEFRFIVHHALLHHLPGAKAAAELFRTNPDADFHAMVADMTGLDRDMAKAVNFAKIFGAGVKKFAEMIGKPLHEATAINDQYNSKLPFVLHLSKICQEMAERIGHTELYDGARRHWHQWEVPWVHAKGAGPCSLEEARRRRDDPAHPWFGQRLRRSRTYTALNALIQGSAARHTKLWMRDCWREGVVPLLQMHDCLDCSVSSREQGELVARLGCEAVKLAVAMRVDLKFGKSWGDAKHSWDDLPAAPNGMKPHIKAFPVKPASTFLAAPLSITAAPSSGEKRRSKAPAAKPAIAAAVKAAIPPPVKPTIVVPVKPAIAVPVKLAITLPGPPSIAAAPAIVPHADNADEETQIDLADLIDEPVPRNRKILCRFHEEKTPSLHIYPDHYFCFGCGAYGDHVNWLMEVDGYDHDTAVHKLETWDGPVVPRPPIPNEDSERTARALQLFDDAQPIAGALAARYLADVRRIYLDALPAGVDGVLRFHTHCPFGSGTRHPCLLALMCDPISNAPTGIQRIALTADARKIDRMMFGPAGVVTLWPAGKRLVIGEGLETVLAAATRLPYRGAPLQPAWAMLSEGALRRFPVIAGVEQLILLADNDRNGAGQAAAEECKRRWVQAGRTGALLVPERPGADFNDIVMEMLERAP